MTSYRMRSISVAASPGMEEVSVIVDPKGKKGGKDDDVIDAEFEETN